MVSLLPLSLILQLRELVLDLTHFVVHHTRSNIPRIPVFDEDQPGYRVKSKNEVSTLNE
jgi:hypothetical protein